MLEAIETSARQMLAQAPGPVVRMRLLCEVLRRSDEDAELQHARQGLTDSRNIQELTGEQREDGGWGAFHTRNTRLKQKIPTTEVGIERGLALGLEPKHLVLEKAATHIVNILQGTTPFPDRHEKNDRWQSGMRLLLASTLSLVQPNHPILDADRELWLTITKMAFQSGTYREEDEIRAYAELTGATVKDSYLVLNNRYALNLLGSLPGTLYPEFEMVLLKWVWELPDGIRYLGIALNRQPPSKSGHLDRWLASLETLARGFPYWDTIAQSAIEWLWDARNSQGTWDFGLRPDSIARLPLSDDWRHRGNRAFDWSTRVLSLLRKYCDAVV